MTRSHSPTFVDLHPAADRFLDDVLAGLASTPKALSPKYFYDARGSDLFEAICADTYGDNRLVAEGVLPPGLVASSPEYLRPVAGIRPVGELMGVRKWPVGEITKALVTATSETAA